ncbi:MAG TPA: hypothetical protein VFC01_19775 [Mycobacterium sp.]|nr:hypothetical protein [Mycobacterium sp.]
MPAHLGVRSLCSRIAGCSKYQRRVVAGQAACRQLSEWINDDRGAQIVAWEFVLDHLRQIVWVGSTDAAATVVWAFTGRTAPVL